MEYLTSDEHFDHFNIIKYCNRPFTSVAEMNERMINEWNSLVTDRDTVYVIGDFALSTIERVQHFCRTLKGRKILIKGNHDRHTIKKYIEAGFHNVAQQYMRTLTIPNKNIDYTNQKDLNISGSASIEYTTWKFILTHKPPQRYYDDVNRKKIKDGEMNEPKNKNLDDANYSELLPYTWNLCGHVHERWKINRPLQILNVGVDVWDFKPITFDKIIETILTFDDDPFEGLRSKDPCREVDLY